MMSVETKQKTRQYSMLVTIVALIFIVAVLGLAFFFIYDEHTDDENLDVSALQCVIHASDGTVSVLPLDKDASTSIETNLGVNVVRVEDGHVFMEDADCDNHDCIYQGSISVPGEQIVCLPHKLWIEIQPLDALDDDSQMDISATHSTLLEQSAEPDVVSR